MAAGAAPIQVAFVLMPDSLILDWAGPAEALRIANQCLVQQERPPAFALRFIGPRPETTTSVGAQVHGIAALPASWPAPTWLVLVGQPGSRIAVDTPELQDLLHWLRPLKLVERQLELVTVCAGALLAAHAGLLSRRRATTHHHHLAELAAVAPDCEVLSNRVFVQDGPLCSSAGVTTGIDLMLHRIAAVCGPALAAQVAQSMVLALRRGPNDPELSPFLLHRNHLHAAMHRVQDAVSQQPERAWTLTDMAAVACTSTRHLARLFLEHSGISPLTYLRQIRLAVAEAALRSGHNVTQAAALAGFQSDTQLRRTWHSLGLSGTPSVGRQ